MKAVSPTLDDADIDAGGIPLDVAIITRIAENFGLEVSRTARTKDTSSGSALLSSGVNRHATVPLALLRPLAAALRATSTLVIHLPQAGFRITANSG
jgi:hypothetical protein